MIRTYIFYNQDVNQPCRFRESMCFSTRRITYQHHRIGNLSNNNFGKRNSFAAFQFVGSIQLQPLLCFSGGETLLRIYLKFTEDIIGGERVTRLGQGLDVLSSRLLGLLSHIVS